MVPDVTRGVSRRLADPENGFAVHPNCFVAGARRNIGVDVTGCGRPGADWTLIPFDTQAGGTERWYR